jgi:hypothetical protein
MSTLPVHKVRYPKMSQAAKLRMSLIPIEKLQEAMAKCRRNTDPAVALVARRRNIALASQKWMEMMKDDPRYQSTPKHVTAKGWMVRDPMGVSHAFKNLQHFIDSHPELFDSSDVVKRKSGMCRAYVGIANLRPSEKRKSIIGSWKGWTWILSKYRDTCDRDALDRQQDQVPESGLLGCRAA